MRQPGVKIDAGRGYVTLFSWLTLGTRHASELLRTVDLSFAAHNAALLVPFLFLFVAGDLPGMRCLAQPSPSVGRRCLGRSSW